MKFDQVVFIILDTPCKAGARSTIYFRECVRIDWNQHNVRPTSLTSVPQTLIWTPIPGLVRYDLEETVFRQSVSKRVPDRVQNRVQKWSPNVPLLKPNRCFWRFLFQFFSEPSKFIIQTAECIKQCPPPYVPFAKINYFPYERTDGRTDEHLLILHSRT